MLTEPTKEEIEKKFKELGRAVDDHIEAIDMGMFLPKRNINLDMKQRAVCEQLYLAKDLVSMLEISEATGLAMRNIMIIVEELKEMGIEIREVSNYGAISYFMPKRIKEFQAKTNCFGFSQNK